MKNPTMVDKVNLPVPIYLDFQATTPLDPRVLHTMMPYLSGLAGNPHSTSHSHGSAALKAVENARAQVASLIGASPDEIVFTSGATEANNLIIRGVTREIRNRERNAVLTATTEHKAVLAVIDSLRAEGFDTQRVQVDRDGMLDLAALRQALTIRTGLVSVMAANNETGVVHDLNEISRLARAQGALVHTDAAQAAGKIPVDASVVDFASISSHKMYGPMGIGAAYIARGLRRRIEPLFKGGGQEGGLRSGTLPVALCVGFGTACHIAAQEMEDEAKRLHHLRELFLETLRSHGTTFTINGTMRKRIPGNINVHFPGIDAEALLMKVRSEISISSGSACTAESLDPSHVLLAMGLGVERAEESVRIGFGRTTVEQDAIKAADALSKAVTALGRVGYKQPVLEI